MITRTPFRSAGDIAAALTLLSLLLGCSSADDAHATARPAGASPGSEHPVRQKLAAMEAKMRAARAQPVRDEVPADVPASYAEWCEVVERETSLPWSDWRRHVTESHALDASLRTLAGDVDRTCEPVHDLATKLDKFASNPSLDTGHADTARAAAAALLDAWGTANNFAEKAEQAHTVFLPALERVDRLVRVIDARADDFQQASDEGRRFYAARLTELRELGEMPQQSVPDVHGARAAFDAAFETAKSTYASLSAMLANGAFDDQLREAGLEPCIIGDTFELFENEVAPQVVEVSDSLDAESFLILAAIQLVVELAKDVIEWLWCGLLSLFGDGCGDGGGPGGGTPGEPGGGGNRDGAGGDVATPGHPGTTSSGTPDETSSGSEGPKGPEGGDPAAETSGLAVNAVQGVAVDDGGLGPRDESLGAVAAEGSAFALVGLFSTDAGYTIRMRRTDLGADPVYRNYVVPRDAAGGLCGYLADRDRKKNIRSVATGSDANGPFLDMHVSGLPGGGDHVTLRFADSEPFALRDALGLTDIAAGGSR